MKFVIQQKFVFVLISCMGFFLRRSLAKTSLEIAHQLYEASLQNTTQNQRQTHATLQTKLNELLVNIRLYEKGLRLLPPDLQLQLVKYLLKTHGTDICNDIFFYVANECSLNYADNNLKPEQRNRIAQDCGMFGLSFLCLFFEIYFSSYQSHLCVH